MNERGEWRTKMSLNEVRRKVRFAEGMGRALFDLGKDDESWPQKLDIRLVESAVRFTYNYHNGEQYLPDELTQKIERAYDDERRYLAVNPFPNGDLRGIIENCTYHSLVRSANEAVDSICAELAHEQVMQEDRASRMAGVLVDKLPAFVQKTIARFVPFPASPKVDKVLRDKYRREAGESYAQLDEIIDILKQKYGGK